MFCYRRLGNGRAYSSPYPYAPEITGAVVGGGVGVSAGGHNPPVGFRGGEGKTTVKKMVRSDPRRKIVK